MCGISRRSFLDQTIRIVLLFKDQRSADAVRKDLSELSNKIETDFRPVFKVERSSMTSISDKSCKFSFDLCYTDYVGCTSRRLFQRITEHKHSAIGQRLTEEHKLQATNLQDKFTVLKKCRTKFDCLIYEMLFIRVGPVRKLNE